MKKQDLIDQATALVGAFDLSGNKDNTAGNVACALMTKNGNVYTGISIVVTCGMGFCAEHAAIAEMLKARETEIQLIVSIKKNGDILPPCGRCREFMYQVDKRNINTKVIIGKNKTVLLKELLPYMWSKNDTN